MRDRHPKGTRLPALEQNILKYRALEMVLVLFYAENLREFVLGSIRATDRFSDSGRDRLPDNTPNVYLKMWKVLIADGIITEAESTAIQALVNFRNDIGHRIHQLTLDVSREPVARDAARFLGPKYDYGARRALKKYREELSQRMASKYVSELSFDSLYFEAAEKTYELELKRLDRKIRKQIETRKKEHAHLNAELGVDDIGLSGQYRPGHPTNRTRSGALSRRDVEICYRLFDSGKSPLAVAYLMRVSYRAALKRRHLWDKEGGPNRTRAELEPLLTKRCLRAL